MYDGYPARVVPDDASGELVMSFRDVPEALTSGDLSDHVVEAEDALIAALDGYMRAKRPIPRPSRLQPGEVMVTLPVVVAAKLLLYDEMRAAGLSKTELAARLDVSEGSVRRLLDLDHESRIDLIDVALQQFGKRLSVHAEQAA